RRPADGAGLDRRAAAGWGVLAWPKSWVALGVERDAAGERPGAGDAPLRGRLRARSAAARRATRAAGRNRSDRALTAARDAGRRPRVRPSRIREELLQVAPRSIVAHSFGRLLPIRARWRSKGQAGARR